MIPNEIVNEIIGYVPNIDIRRNFNVYDKLNTKEYNILNTITRKNGLDTIGYKRFYCNDNIYFDSINNEPQLNDFVDFIYKEKNNNVYIEIHIWKLIEKEYCGEKNKNDGIYYLQDFDDLYYWKDIIVKYSII